MPTTPPDIATTVLFSLPLCRIDAPRLRQDMPPCAASDVTRRQNEMPFFPLRVTASFDATHMPIFRDATPAATQSRRHDYRFSRQSPAFAACCSLCRFTQKERRDVLFHGEPPSFSFGHFQKACLSFIFSAFFFFFFVTFAAAAISMIRFARFFIRAMITYAAASERH